MKIKIAIVDERIPIDALRALNARGFRVVTMPPSRKLPTPLASHTDMLLARVGGEYVTSADYLEEAPFGTQEIYDLTRTKIHFTADIFGEEYPRDAIFNSLIMGEHLFIKADTASPYLLSLAKEKGYNIVPVKQGYPACTVLKLSETAAITADDGMKKALTECGVRVYKISSGGISLAPYEYGFIGGCAGIYDGCVYFMGNPKLHPDGEKIISAISAEGLRAVSLTTDRLLDVGGIFFTEGDVN